MEASYPAGKKLELLSKIERREAAIPPPAYRGGSVLAAILMIEKYIEAISAGQVMAVDWRTIKDMLGEEPQRTHTCTIFRDSGSFPPQEKVFSDQIAEEQIDDILHQAGVRFMAESYKDGKPYLPIETRYFSSVKLAAGPWIKNPNHK